jgi:hypothetical protein
MLLASRLPNVLPVSARRRRAQHGAARVAAPTHTWRCQPGSMLTLHTWAHRHSIESGNGARQERRGAIGGPAGDSNPSGTQLQTCKISHSS